LATAGTAELETGETMAKKELFEPGKYIVRAGSKDGKRGIYLRAYNVRAATFNEGFDDLADYLENHFDLEARPRHLK
jgi:hypothetical protein